MKKLLLFFVLATLHAAVVQGQYVETPLDSLRLQFESEARFAVDEFEAYSEQARAEYEQFVESIKLIWGGDSVVENTRTEWVEYSDDNTSRSIVDFDKGNIVVEVALDADEASDEALVNSRLTEAVERVLGSRGSTHPYNGSEAEGVSETPILDGIVDLSAYRVSDAQVADNKANTPPYRKTPPAPTVKSGTLNLSTSAPRPKPVAVGGQTMAERRLQGEGTSSQLEQREQAREQALAKAAEKQQINVKVNGAPAAVNVAAAAAAVVSQSPRVATPTTGGDGKQRTVVKVEMAMATDYLNEKAAQYKHLVSEFSKAFQIEEPLIYAVMEQESRFNPQAKSHVPAYGLMQLVPSSGGCDAYTYVKKLKQPAKPEPSYLYIPRNNIELGTAYLRILMNRFSSVTDPDCRRLCVIAAYNTGEGNVSRSFVGKAASAKSIASHINALNYSQLYNHLTTRLSTSEARGYVEGVSRRREKYMK